jgi:hypothetical protein
MLVKAVSDGGSGGLVDYAHHVKACSVTSNAATKGNTSVQHTVLS